MQALLIKLFFNLFVTTHIHCQLTERIILSKQNTFQRVMMMTGDSDEECGGCYKTEDMDDSLHQSGRDRADGNSFEIEGS